MSATSGAPDVRPQTNGLGLNASETVSGSGPIMDSSTSAPKTPAPPNAATTSLSADEIALYDRQIRLWGAQAQERIRSANILLVSLRALGTEIAKNLTLAGIRSLTIVDDEPVTEEDLGAQYFVRMDDIGKPRAQAALPRIQELNPRVSVTADGSLASLLACDQSYYAQFDCVIACDHDFMTLSIINTTARFLRRPFYAAGIHGFYGYIFADLVAHEYVIEREKSNVTSHPGPESVTRTLLDVSIKRENSNGGGGSSAKLTELVRKREIYCPLLLANSSSLPPEVHGNRRKLKGVPALLPCLRALFDFERTYGRLPGHTPADLAVFTTLATSKARELLLPPETLKSEFLRSFMQNVGSDIVPTAAFVGGRLSEDVINVLGQREQPIQNFALFDGEALEGKIYSLFSPPPELSSMAINSVVVDPAQATFASETTISNPVLNVTNAGADSIMKMPFHTNGSAGGLTNGPGPSNAQVETNSVGPVLTDEKEPKLAADTLAPSSGSNGR